MDLQAIWHEHKVYLRNVGIGAAVYLVLMYQAQSYAVDAQQLARDNARKEQSLRETERSLEGVEGLEKGRSEALEQQVEPKVLEKLLWSLRPERSVPADSTNRYLSFTEKRREATEVIRRAAERRNTRLPSSFGFLSESEESLVDEHCVRLDLTEALLLALLDAGAEAIFSVKQDDATAQPLPGEDAQFLQRVPVIVEVQLAPEKIPAVIAAMQQPKRFAELLRFEARRTSAKGGDVKVLIELAALRRTKTPGGKAGAAVGGDARPPAFPDKPLRRFGRRR